ncbi:MAG: antitoxin [Candidatus Marinimicrobia bacterium]|nr:antitoxin [Candidatus Neomarinimicrobiota bacterium]
MSKIKLDPEEQQLLDSYEDEEWVPIRDQGGVRARFAAVAAASHRKDQRINIRLTARDLDQIRVRALEEGIPYQTLIGSILHKYVTGRLVETR